MKFERILCLIKIEQKEYKIISIEKKEGIVLVELSNRRNKIRYLNAMALQVVFMIN